MSRTSLIVIVVGVLAVCVGLYVLFFNKNAPATNTPPQTNGVGYDNTSTVTSNGTTNGVMQQNTFALPGRDGRSVMVKDFGGARAPSTDMLYIAGGNASDKLPYTIGYFRADQSITVTLYEEPIGQVRIAAEKDLMERLNIGQYDMCRLKYAVYVPIRLNEIYSGTNLGFSFCPGATALP